MPQRLGDRLQWRRTTTAYLFILPALVLYVVIIVVPVGYTVFLSTMKWDGLNPVKEFVGIANYVKALTSPRFYRAFGNNLIWLSLFVTVPLILALFLAIGVTNKRVKGRDQLQAIYFIPYVISPVVIALVWKWIYSPNVGILSWILQSLRLVDEPFGLLGHSRWALFGIIFAHIWNQFGFSTVIYVNGLQSINQDLYDAADIDGANPFQRLVHVTLPGLSSVTTFLVLLAMINSFKVFNFVFLMTQGGPASSTEVVAYRVYVEAFILNNVGYGSAQAVLLSVVVLIIGTIYVNQRERKLAVE